MFQEQNVPGLKEQVKTSLSAVHVHVFSCLLCGRYGTGGMFSLAVAVPEGQNQNVNQVLQQVFRSDPGNNVKNSLNNNQVYVGSRVIAAKVYRRPGGTDHAESRVVDQLSRLAVQNRNDLLLFYVYASPCVEKCSSDTHQQSILTRIRGITGWSNHAVVFSKIFKPNTGPGNTDQQRREALQRLGASVGLANIFRCDGAGWRQCTSCSNNGQVAHYCVSG